MNIHLTVDQAYDCVTCFVLTAILWLAVFALKNREDQEE